MNKDYTLAETFELLGIPQTCTPWCAKMAKDMLPSSTGELDWRCVRVDVRERSTGVPELVISIPFGIEGL